MAGWRQIKSHSLPNWLPCHLSHYCPFSTLLHRSRCVISVLKSVPSRTSLAVHRLRLHASKAGDVGLLSGCKTKIPHIAHHGQKINYKKSAPSNSSKPKAPSRKWSPSQPGLSRMLQSPPFFLFRLFPTHHTFLPCLSAVNPSEVYLPHLPGRFLFLSS